MKKVFLFGDPAARSNYSQALAALALSPVVTADLAQAAACDALLLPGGGDLDPALFGQKNQGSQAPDPALDQIELQLVRQFTGKPILGICRGMQVINVAFGGDLIQDLPTAAAHRWNQADQVHPIAAKPDSFLHKLYGASFSVNSAHHQGVGRLAKGFRAAALAADGVVEAIECPGRRIFGVQWHPERMALAHARPDTVDGLEAFRFFAGLM